MEFIDGEDLASLLRRIGRLPKDKAIELAREICAGVGAAHELGVIHRDLKPANVMIDGRGRARVADFGLASAVDELGGGRDTMAGDVTPWPAHRLTWPRSSSAVLMRPSRLISIPSAWCSTSSSPASGHTM